MQYNPIAIFDIPVFPSQKIRGIFLEKEGEGDNMRRISLLWKVVRITHAEQFAVGYVLLLFLVAVAVWLAEPSITTLADSLWYCFAAFTTIGFGDFVAVTWGGRILTVLLALYGIFVVALVPGVMVNYFIEFNKIRYNESLVLFMDQLEHLDTLSKEELREISAKVRNFRRKSGPPA